MTEITVSVPDDLPEDEKRSLIENQVESSLGKQEQQAQYNNHLRELYRSVNDATGSSLQSTNDLIFALARFASSDLKEKLIGQPHTIYPWQKPES